MYSNKTFKRLIVLPLCLFCLSAFSQSYEYIEKKEDEYLAQLAQEKRIQKPYHFSSKFITTIQVNTDLNGNDILNDAANEPSFAMDINDSDRMVIGWRQFDNIESNFRQAGISYSLDRGTNWNYLDPIEKGLFRSDPVLSTDLDGNFYYNSLKQDYVCDVFKTHTLNDWSDKTYAIGGDKQWMVIDKTETSSQGSIYAFWKSSFSDCDNGNFTRSFNAGTSYESCSLTPQNITRGTLNVGPDGALYACGGLSGQHVVLKSETAKDPQSEVLWEPAAFVDLKGEQALYAGPNPAGMLGQMWVATDHSNLDSRGNVYVLSSTKRSDNNDPADIMFSKSVDGGKTWNEAIKINSDNSTENWQWFGTLSVAPNSRIDVTWLDTRDNPGTFLSTLYYKSSMDAGETWTEDIALSEAFDPHLGFPNQLKIGDYYHMNSTNEGAHLAWAATFNGGQDIYYSYIPAEPDATSTEDLGFGSNINSVKIYPNPANAYVNATIESNAKQKVDIKLFDIMGNLIWIKSQVSLSIGSNTIQISRTQLTTLDSGVYYLHVSMQDQPALHSKVLFLDD